MSSQRGISKTLPLIAIGAVAFVIIVFAASNFFATGTLTWSLYPICSCLLGLFVLLPTLALGGRGVIPSMVVLTVLFAPFVYLMCLFTGTVDVAFAPTVSFTAIGVAYLWCIVLAFKLLHGRPRLAFGIIFICGALVFYGVTMVLSAMLPAYAQHIQGWQFLGVIICVPVGAAFIGVDYVRHIQELRRQEDIAEKKARRKAARKGKL